MLLFVYSKPIILSCQQILKKPLHLHPIHELLAPAGKVGEVLTQALCQFLSTKWLHLVSVCQGSIHLRRAGELTWCNGLH